MILSVHYGRCAASGVERWGIVSTPEEPDERSYPIRVFEKCKERIRKISDCFFPRVSICKGDHDGDACQVLVLDNVAIEKLMGQRPEFFFDQEIETVVTKRLLSLEG